MKTVPLGKLTTLISSGSTPLGGAKIYLPSGPVMLIRSQNVLMRQLSLDDVAFITEEIASKMQRTVVKTNDVLLNITGASIGRVSTFELEETQANVNQHVCIVRAIPELLHYRYLMHFIAQPSFQAHIDSTQDGGTRQALTFEKIRNFQIPLPPIAEQRRIAAILDRADAIRRKRQQAIALTEELLRSAFLEMFGDPVTNPKDWQIKPMDQVIEKIDAGWCVKGEERPCQEDEWGVLKVSAVTSGRFKAYENKVVTPPSDKSLVIPKRGDLLCSRANTRELVAATCIVEADYENIFLSDKLWRIRTKKNIANIEYLRFLLSDPQYRSLITKKATGTSGSMLNISQAKLLEMHAPIPDISTQRAFADIVWNAFALREKHETASIESEAAFNSLLQRAFRGEL